MAPRGHPSGLARSDALHIGLTGIVLEGGDLAVIAREVAEVLDLGAAFTSTDGRERGAHLSEEQRSEEHTSELQSRRDLVCRLLLEKKKILVQPQKGHVRRGLTKSTG